MAIISLELVAILTVAFLVRALNKFPPLHERLLVGLKFFELLLPDQIALFVQQTSSQLSDVSTVGLGLSTAYDRAIQTVDQRAHAIAYSYFPQCRFPWANLMQLDTLQLVVMTSTYGILGYLVSSLVEIVTSSGYSGNVDMMLLAVFAAVIFSPIPRLALLGFRHSETLISFLMGVLGFITCMFAIHAPEKYAVFSVRVNRVLADIAGIAVPAAIPTIQAASPTNVDGDAVAAADAEAEFSTPPAIEQVILTSFLNPAAPEPDHPDYFWASIVLALVLGVCAAMLYPSLSRLARTYLLVAKKGSPELVSTTQRVLAGFAVVTPLFIAALFSPRMLGDFGFVPSGAVPCSPSEMLRDCDAITGAPIGNTLSSTSNAPYIHIQLSESGWLAARLVVSMAASVFMLSQVRTLVQGHLLQVRHVHATRLVSTAASALNAAAVSSKGHKYTHEHGALQLENLPLTSEEIDSTFQRCRLDALAAAVEVSHVVAQLLAWPIAMFLLAALALHRGHLSVGISVLFGRLLQTIGLDAASLARKPIGDTHLPGTSVSLSEAMTSLLGADVLGSPYLRLFSPAHGLVLALFSLAFLAAFSAVLVVLLVLFNEHIMPSMVGASNVGSTSLITTPAAPAPVAVGNNKQDSKKKR